MPTGITSTTRTMTTNILHCTTEATAAGTETETETECRQFPEITRHMGGEEEGGKTGGVVYNITPRRLHLQLSPAPKSLRTKRLKGKRRMKLSSRSSRWTEVMLLQLEMNQWMRFLHKAKRLPCPPGRQPVLQSLRPQPLKAPVYPNLRPSQQPRLRLTKPRKTKLQRSNLK